MQELNGVFLLSNIFVLRRPFARFLRLYSQVLF